MTQSEPRAMGDLSARRAVVRHVVNRGREALTTGLKLAPVQQERVLGLVSMTTGPGGRRTSIAGAFTRNVMIRTLASTPPWSGRSWVQPPISTSAFPVDVRTQVSYDQTAARWTSPGRTNVQD